MKRKGFLAAGLGLLMVGLLAGPVNAQDFSAADLTVSKCLVPSTTDGSGWLDSQQADDFAKDVVRATEQLTGAPKGKERIADQLRRGIVGTVVDETAKTINVVTTPEFAQRSSLTSSLGTLPGRTRVVTGCRSAAELIEADDILNARSWESSAGRATFSYSLSAADSRFHVNFAPQFSAAADALRKQLGDRAVVTLGTAGRMGRLDDGSAHFGGAGIREGAGTVYNNYCTSAFTAYSYTYGTGGAFTAGHCFNDSSVVYSGPKLYGWTYGKRSYPLYDVIGIRKVNSEAYDNGIHVDPCCPTVRYVNGREYAYVGQKVCFSGITTRATCGIYVTSVNGTFCDGDGCTPGLIEAMRNNQVIVRAGDSGAPIYRGTGTNTALAVGMVIAAAGGGTIAYGEHIWQIENYLNVSTLTS